MGRWAGAPVSATLRRVGILGGTFDPIHAGHLHAAGAASSALALDIVVFVPAGRPWQKHGYAPAEDRYQMVVAATAHDPRFCVSRAEIDRPGDTFTVETLTLLRDFYGATCELFLIVGADAAANIPTWHRADEIADLARVAVVARPPADIAALKDAIPGYPSVIIDAPEVDVSATTVRRLVEGGRLEAGPVPDPVVRYIRRHGLYRQSDEAKGFSTERST